MRKRSFAYDLQPVLDDLFAFWGCLDDNVEDEECRNIIKCGNIWNAWICICGWIIHTV